MHNNKTKRLKSQNDNALHYSSVILSRGTGTRAPHVCALCDQMFIKPNQTKKKKKKCPTILLCAFNFYLRLARLFVHSSPLGVFSHSHAVQYLQTVSGNSKMFGVNYNIQTYFEIFHSLHFQFHRGVLVTQYNRFRMLLKCRDGPHVIDTFFDGFVQSKSFVWSCDQYHHL